VALQSAADVAAAGGGSQALQGALAAEVLVLGEAVSEDRWKLGHFVPLPVVALLVRDQHDAVRVRVARGLTQGTVGVLHRARGEELHAPRRPVRADVAVRVQVDPADLLAGHVGGREVPLPHDLAIVAHAARVVDHDRDRLGGVLDDGVDDLGSGRLRDLQDVAGLQRVGPRILVAVVAVPVRALANAVFVLELRAAQVVQPLQLRFVGEHEVQPGDVVVFGASSDVEQVVSAHDRVARRVGDGRLGHGDVMSGGGIGVLVPAAGDVHDHEAECASESDEGRLELPVRIELVQELLHGISK
jgi:hypothetical protein